MVCIDLSKSKHTKGREIINDSGKITGVHFWATLSINTKQGAIEMPMHLSFHMDEGKISGEYGFYNLSILDKNSQEHPIKEQIK